ncbi:MAG: cytochrome b/b6 domain-containing protein, partial [Candidatus Contendobacter sp.]|nr:cytochrome b/b6 domain-containing protein [Candidatus Contendobacter sp.]
GPDTVFTYVKAVLTLRAPRHLGHNPAGGAMIIILLLSLVITVSAGLLLYGAEKGLGPLAGLLVDSSDNAIDVFKEVHEFFANFTVILVIGHLVGVVWESLLHRENLAHAMITGRKRA